MGNYITMDIELQAVKSFLNKSLEIVDAEVSSICKKKEAGEFPDPDGFSNALFVPMQHEAISIRAVFYELNALIEWELHNIALAAYRNSAQYAQTPKFIGDVPLEESSRIKFVHDLPIGEIHRLIEQYYKIKLSNLPGAVEIETIRKTVNAFKHRKGFKDFRRDSCSKFLERFKPDRNEDYKVIEVAREFLRTLWKKTKFRQ